MERKPVVVGMTDALCRGVRRSRPETTRETILLETGRSPPSAAALGDTAYSSFADERHVECGSGSVGCFTD
jgi:hypothetical protein